MRQRCVRRARSLVAYWDGGDFVIENFLTGNQTAISPLVAHLLARLDAFRPAAEARAIFRDVPGGEDLFDALLARGLLVVEGSRLDEREGLLESTWRWSREAPFYHFASRRVSFLEGSVQAEALARLARTEPPPSPYKTCGPLSVRFPPSFDRSGELWRTLLERRTRRSLSGEPVTLDELATILGWTWGQTRALADPNLGPYFLRTSPSGGARQPIEAYPVVLRVDGLAPGVYHYSVKEHGLELLRPGSLEDEIVSLCGNQSWVRNAAAVVFMTAVLERTTWKYRHAHAYRVLHLDAGHLGQTFHLVCTRLGLAPLTFAAFSAEHAETVLGVDGMREIVVYAAAVGQHTRK